MQAFCLLHTLLFLYQNLAGGRASARPPIYIAADSTRAEPENPPNNTTEPLKGPAGERLLSRAGGNDGKPVWPTAGPNARRYCPIQNFNRSPSSPLTVHTRVHGVNTLIIQHFRCDMFSGGQTKPLGCVLARTGGTQRRQRCVQARTLTPESAHSPRQAGCERSCASIGRTDAILPLPIS